MDGLGFLVAAASFVMVLIALNKISKLDLNLAQLKLQLGNLVDELAKPRQTGDSAQQAQPAVEAVLAIEAEPAIEAIAAVEPEPATPPAPPPEPAPVRPPRDMEQALASRWFVWIGGIAIAIGGLLFVKYAYDNGLIPPALQVLFGLLLGAALVAAGEWLRRRPSTQSGETDYVPAALSAAGLATAFAAIFAAYALYELIAPVTAFAGLAIVALGALVLSRLQGPLIAALGLLGSYATPALIPSSDPSAWSFFPYLLIILIACFATLRGRNWWWLAYAAIAGSGIWALLWIGGGVYEPSDRIPIGLFALLLGAIAVFGIRGLDILDTGSGSLKRPGSMTQPLIAGIAGIAVAAGVLAFLVGQSDHSALALALFFLGTAAAVALGWAKRGLSPLAVAAALVSYLVLMLWREAAFHQFAMDETGYWTSLPGAGASEFLNWMMAAGAGFTAVGLAGARLKVRPSMWAMIAASSSFLFIAGAWARVDALLPDLGWVVASFGAAALLLAVVWLERDRHDETNPNFASGILLIGSAALVLFGLDRLFDGVWLTVAMAAAAAAYAFASKTLHVKLIGAIAAALASLTAIRLFASRELWEDDRSVLFGQHWPLYGYGVPAILFLLSSRWLRSSGHARAATAMEGISLGLAISLVSLELRVLIGGGLTSDEPQLLEIAAHILTWLGAAYGLMYRQEIFSSFISLWGARILIAVSSAAIVLLSLGVLNPVVSEEPVPGNALFNALLLAYLAPVLLLGPIARKLGVLGWQQLRPAMGILALVLALAYVTLETKFLFQGRLMVPWSLSGAESYAYSAVWLASALALFVAGIRLGRQYIRYAGLAVMVVVVLKVFLSDMSDLEGLYRIASFIGLGLCLVGIGWLYQRFVQQPRGGITTA